MNTNTNTNNSSPSRTSKIAGNCLLFFGALVLIASAGAKFAHVPKVVNDLGAMGFEGTRLTLIAITELLSALLFLVPKTRSLGLLLVSSYMGGAIATHVQHGQSFLQPAFILSLIWLGVLLRHPQVLWSMSSPAYGPGGFVSHGPEKRALAGD
jgi:hypothetical protein